MKVINSIKVIIVTLTLLLSTVLHAEQSPMSIDGATTIDATQAKALFDNGALFVDVRSDKDWDAGRIPDAMHIELKKEFNIAALSAEAKKTEAIVIYCNGSSCLRSAKASKLAVRWGFTNINYFRLGYPAWKEANFPVE